MHRIPRAMVIALDTFLAMTIHAGSTEDKSAVRRTCPVIGPSDRHGTQIRPIGGKAFDVVRHCDGWAFPAARGKGHFVGLAKVLDRLCERAKLAGVTVHVLRHSFAATAAGWASRN
ncbi:MAG: hypothetical protein AB7P12_08130 [Alphaproteobacteria bacterium]